MNQDEPFKVYIKPGCPWCIEAIDYLKKGGYAYEEIDVIANPSEFQKMQEISGQSSAPTMTVGDLLLADFGVDELIPFLEENGLLK